MNKDVDTRSLLGLMGVLVTAMAAEFNDQITSAALVDVLGALHVAHDPGTWITSLYVSAEVIGMFTAAWCSVTFSPRRFTLFVIALNAGSTLLIPTTTALPAIYTLRILQGLAGGLSIPLLMATALRVLSPSIRLYGLAAYALTASFAPNFATTLTALWVDVVGWRFVFLEAIPLCSIAAALVWFGMPQDELFLERFARFDWRGLVLAIVGLGSLTTMLQQGDRLDWFNSSAICVLALLSAVGTPLLFVNEWFHELPFLKIQLLSRRNIAYGLVALFMFSIIGLSASEIPLTFLGEVKGYRPIQSYLVTLEVAASQLILLPLIAKLLDFKWVDARVVSFIGLALIFTACVGSSFVNSQWNRDQFFLWQVFQAMGQPLVVMPLLMITTNSIAPHEGPFAAALINTPRALAEATGAWMLQLTTRWRGTLHTNRLLDQVGDNRFSLIQANPLLPRVPAPLLPDGIMRDPGSLGAFSAALQRQAAVLTLSDAYLVIAALTVCLAMVLLVLPVRTLPPRIQLAKQ